MGRAVVAIVCVGDHRREHDDRIVLLTHPFWSLTLFTIDILVIYGLIAHGKRSLA